MRALLCLLIACKAGAVLPLREVEWNPAASPVGNVSTIAEDRDTVLLLSDTGASIFVAGLSVAQDNSATDWRQATVIPSADGGEPWLVSLDGTGQLRRVRNKLDFEPIGDRYGLLQEDVQSVAALGTYGAAFALSGTLVLADGKTVTRYDTPQCSRFDPQGVSGSPGGALCIGGGGLFILNAGALTEAKIPSVSEVSSGVAVTGADVWRQDASGAFSLVYSDKTKLRSPVVSGDRLWMIAGPELLMLDASNKATHSKGAAIADDARLVGSPSGDVWVISGGALKRFAFDDATLQAERDWETSIQPIYVRTCSQCHAPGGSANIDLSTYQTWLDRKDKIHLRVIEQANMPPAGTTLPGADKDAIRVFTEAM